MFWLLMSIVIMGGIWAFALLIGYWVGYLLFKIGHFFIVRDSKLRSKQREAMRVYLDRIGRSKAALVVFVLWIILFVVSIIVLLIDAENRFLRRSDPLANILLVFVSFTIGLLITQDTGGGGGGGGDSLYHYRLVKRYYRGR